MNMLKVVRNLTPKRLRIEGEDGQWLVLAPLGTSGPVDDKAGLAPFRLERLMLQNLVSVEDVPATEKFEWVFQLALTVGFVYLVFGTQLIGEVAKSHPTVAEYSVHLWIGGALVIVLCLALVVAITWKGREVVQRVAAQFFSLFLILATGIGLPALAIFYFGGVRGLIHGALSLELLGRLLQLVFIATASLLPALLYFLFDRQQLGTLRQRFEQQIFRLDPSVKTLTDVRARYGQQIEEAYGAVREVRLIRGTRWPILVATLVLAIGWILTLLPVGDASKVSDPAQLWRFFEPQPTLVAFGFLGSYFFALNMVLRRYVRGDLKPKAYSGIVVRIFVVVVLAWVVGLLFPDNTPRHTMGLILVFFIGIVPETGLTFLRESLSRHRPLRTVAADGRRGHERPGARAPRPDRPHAGDPDPRPAARGLDRPSNPLPAPRRRGQRGRQGGSRTPALALLRHPDSHKPGAGGGGVGAARQTRTGRQAGPA